MTKVYAQLFPQLEGRDESPNEPPDEPTRHARLTTAVVTRISPYRLSRVSAEMPAAHLVHSLALVLAGTTGAHDSDNIASGFAYFRNHHECNGLRPRIATTVQHSACLRAQAEHRVGVENSTAGSVCMFYCMNGRAANMTSCAWRACKGCERCRNLTTARASATATRRALPPSISPRLVLASPPPPRSPTLSPRYPPRYRTHHRTSGKPHAMPSSPPATSPPAPVASISTALAATARSKPDKPHSHESSSSSHDHLDPHHASQHAMQHASPATPNNVAHAAKSKPAPLRPTITASPAPRPKAATSSPQSQSFWCRVLGTVLWPCKSS
jgi:hypothetical protein